MKKQIIAAVLLAGTCGNLFAQGYINFAATGGPIKDDFTVPATSSKASATVDFAVLWGTGNALIGSTGSPAAAGATSTAVNWQNILNDPNFTFALNAANGQLITSTTTTGLGAGNFSAGDLSVLNTTAGASYVLIVVGWNAAYATPQAAAAANAAVGWSSAFTYATGASSIATVPTLTQSGLTSFGVNPIPTPEPGTMALAGLGIAGLLALRRKK